MFVYVLVVFFSYSPIGLLTSREFHDADECMAVAAEIPKVAEANGQARGVCVVKEVKVRS